MGGEDLSDKLLEIAGLAAEALERRGFVSVARKRDGVVTLEWWKTVGMKRFHMSRVIKDAELTPDILAEMCAADFRAASGHATPS
ncbi:MAG: hypothetical protein HUU21_03040 [Polyangiaceae bacterium]|nr:hypothetical protein [Polyangiaceae bacterium]NUQ72505.1 hypothetical protein [Polyangiaceae bacterium]